MTRHFACQVYAMGHVALIAMLAVLLSACGAGGFRLDPAASAEMADMATEPGNMAEPELVSEQAVKAPGPRVQPGVVTAQAAAVNAALANPGRPASDRARDQARQSAAVLTFFGITPGMTVLDVFSGGGYYTEILSYLVGPKGWVVAHNNTPYLEFAKADLSTRYAPGRLPNVERIVAENNQLELPANRFDAVLMTNAYHDIYFVDEEHGWAKIDGPRLLAVIYQSMKPGAVLGVVDHAAAPGTSPEAGGALHRIDPDLLKREIEAAGFVFEAGSDVLRNPGDDGTRSSFDPSIRGRTNQVVFRFRKPRR
jgi:predicted methyltransferase